MQHRLLFDVTSPPYGAWLFSLSGLLFVAGGVVFYLVAREKYGRTQAIGAGIIVSLVGIGFTVMTGTDVLAQHAALVADLREGRVTTLEGRVTRYVHRGYHLDHTPESWVVNGRSFVIRPSEVRVSFNDPDVVHPGDSLRITLAGDAIVRLERIEH